MFLAAIRASAWVKTDPQREWLVYGSRAKHAALLTSAVSGGALARTAHQRGAAQHGNETQA